MRSIINIDCNEGMTCIPDDSIDLILTDPPYVKDQWEAAYQTLATQGARILKPSGYLISYCGHINLNRIMRIMDDAGLSYYWIVMQGNHGAKCLVHSRNIIAGFKPIIVYQKPPVKATNRVSLDVVTGKRSKTYHAWQQDIHEAIHLLRVFAKPGDRVLDPFAGTGTTGLAAKALGLNYIGYEIDPETFAVALGRMEQEPLTVEAFL